MKRQLIIVATLATVLLAACLMSVYYLIPRYPELQSQQIAASINAVAALLMAPGKVVLTIIFPPVGHAWSPLQQALACALTIGLAALGAAVGVLAYHKLKPREMPSPALPEAAALPPSPATVPVSRRVFLGAVTTVAASAAAAGSYGVFIEPRRLRTVRQPVAITDLHPDLVGLRIVQLTDLHYSECVPLEHLARMVEQANSLKPDLVLLTGDYVTHGARYVQPVFEVLEKLQSRHGVLAVLGNHDIWSDQAETERHLKRLQFDLLTNTRVFLRPDRTLRGDAREGLCLAGVGDVWTQEVSPAAALGGVPRHIPRILLSHNPDAAEDPLLRPHRVDLMISGHTHGGQVRLPIAGTPIVPSQFGARYAHGLNQGPVCPVYTSAGIGTAMLPIRLGVPPEVVLLEFTSSA